MYYLQVVGEENNIFKTVICNKEYMYLPSDEEGGGEFKRRKLIILFIYFSVLGFRLLHTNQGPVTKSLPLGLSSLKQWETQGPNCPVFTEGQHFTLNLPIYHLYTAYKVYDAVTSSYRCLSMYLLTTTTPTADTREWRLNRSWKRIESITGVTI